MSIGVDPRVAHDRRTTVAQAHELWSEVVSAIGVINVIVGVVV